MLNSRRLIANSALTDTESSAIRMFAGKEMLFVTPWRFRLPVTFCCEPAGSMPVTVKVVTGKLAASKKSRLLRWPSSRLSSAQVDCMAILNSGVPAILPAATLIFPAKFLNPPLWLRVTLEPTKPIVDSDRMTYSRPAADASEGDFFGSDAEALWTLSAGSEQPAIREAATAAMRGVNR